MVALRCQTCSCPHPFHPLKAPDAQTTCLALAAVRVSYTLAGVPTTETIPAQSRAHAWVSGTPWSGAAPALDLSGERGVLFIVAGAPTELWLIGESGWHDLTIAHDVLGVGWVLQHEVRPFQVRSSGCVVLPAPTDAPVLSADTPGESPAAAQLISAITARLIYLDGYGGYSLEGPSATLSPGGGAGRITVTAGGGGTIPLGVRRVLLYCDSISTVDGGGTPITTDGPCAHFYPVDIVSAGTMPPIELWAHDATTLLGLLNNGQSPPASNTSSLPRPGSGCIPDPGPIPAGASIGGLSGTWSYYGVRYRKASLHLAYGCPLGLPFVPPGHGPTTQLGPGTVCTSGSLTDTVSIPAMSGHPPDATVLAVWVLHYHDGTNLAGLYGYNRAITGGATPAFTFTTDDANTSTLPGSFSDLRYPIYYDEAIVNPPCASGA